MMREIGLVAGGGAIGAIARFATVSLAQRILPSTFPYGTLIVNVLGAFTVGLLMAFMFERIAQIEPWRLFLVVGFLGAYTTFSSFAWETWLLYQEGAWSAALANILLNNILTLFILCLGSQLGRYWGNVS